MKKIIFEIRIDEDTDKIATAWKTEGYSRDKLTDQLEILGILENTKNLISNKINTIVEKKL